MSKRAKLSSQSSYSSSIARSVETSRTFIYFTMYSKANRILKFK